ncbi:MAG: preprotein translocase subunit SecG [Planctomycetota bacterium]|nr:MAG: preprotein translocase subunit SecG [Planctomycetota bacterium]
MLEVLLYVLLVFTSLLLVLIVLVQEGKGGGLTDAFGSSGVEAFGVRPGGINKVTFALFALFLLSALGIHWMNLNPNRGSIMEGLEPGFDNQSPMIPDLGPPATPPGTPPEDGGGAPEQPQ